MNKPEPSPQPDPSPHKPKLIEEPWGDEPPANPSGDPTSLLGNPPTIDGRPPVALLAVHLYFMPGQAVAFVAKTGRYGTMRFEGVVSYVSVEADMKHKEVVRYTVEFLVNPRKKNYLKRQITLPAENLVPLGPPPEQSDTIQA